MRISHIILILFIGMIIFSTFIIFIKHDIIQQNPIAGTGLNDLDPTKDLSNPVTRARANNPPILKDLSVYFEEDYIVFEVNYTDLDEDEGTVLLYIDDNPPEEMRTGDFEPTQGQYYYARFLESEMDDNSEFYFTADDNNGGIITLDDPLDHPFVVGDFVGWGERPVLSAPGLYFNGDDWVFNVTYSDPDGDRAQEVYLYINYEAILMSTNDPNPLKGQNYIAYVIESDVDSETEFHFEVVDVNGSYNALYDENWEYFIVGDFLETNGSTNGGSNNNGGGTGDGEDDGKISLGRWGDPEVIVAIIALLGMGIGSGVGIWFRKKKRKRFSLLLTKIDEVYSSYKMHPRKCELELEKIRVEVDSDLKESVIDENNYSILKTRIDEIKQEIRRESLQGKIQDLPKDIELQIKDMLIDGKISQAEYKKFMKVLKSSTMTTSDKKEMMKLVETWMKEEQMVKSLMLIWDYM
jgi:hypothetical protein